MHRASPCRPPVRSRALSRLGFALLIASVLCRRSDAVVISEIHYHPPEGEDGLEFIELANETTTPVDLSGWAFVEGIELEFPPGTILGSRGHIVVCVDRDAVVGRYGIENAIGNATGRLDNDGERITLVNHAGVIVATLRFRDRGKWPTAPDGTGHTLALRKLWLDPSEPESWAPSAELGGTPGRPNFDEEEEAQPLEVVIDRGAPWRYRRGSAPFSSPSDAWIAPDFDDAAWESGPSGFGFGDDDDATVLDDMQGSYSSVAVRTSFSISALELGAGIEWLLGVDYDDGFVAFVNGVEVARANAGTAGTAPAWDASATGSREAGLEELFTIPASALRLGSNTIAIVGYNLGASSSDFSLAPRLLRRGGGGGAELPLLLSSDAWAIRKGTQPFSQPESAWLLPSFDDSSWDVLPGGFGFERSSGEAPAYVVPAGTVGNQEYGGSLGMDFDVVEGIVVRRLGVFDSGADGLARTISARLYDRTTRALLAELLFTPSDPGELIGGSRFKSLPAPIALSPGFAGTIVAEGYGAGEPNGNQGLSPLDLAMDDGAGAISFVGGGRYGNPGAFPTTNDGGPENRYAAGTFAFAVTGQGGNGVTLPTGAATLLDDMDGAYTSIAIRASFDLPAGVSLEESEAVLAIDWDDGFSAYLNGVEIARAGSGAPGEVPRFDGVATETRAVRGERRFRIDPSILAAEGNVLAIAGHNVAVDDADFLLRASIVLRSFAAGPRDASGIVFNELYRGQGGSEGFVELYNSGSGPVDLGGFILSSGDPAHDALSLPAGTSIAAKGFLVLLRSELPWDIAVPESRFFLIAPDGRVVTGAMFDRATNVGGTEHAEARFPDGGELEWLTDTPTPGAPNDVPRVEGIVLNEIFYHPPVERRGEWIELHNTNALAFDLSGFRFSDGIDYVFPNGTMIPAGGYLVVAEDPDLFFEIYGFEPLGPYDGQLSNDGEAVRLVDAIGNPVDHVRYFDGGDWSLWADGRGSSLELIDPFADNSAPAAWGPSDESGKADWEEFRFSVDDYIPSSETELKLYLVERGICLVDDVTISGAGGTNLIPNGGFETTTAPWRIGGTHIRSRRTTEDSASGLASLRIESSGRGDMLVNRIETDTSPRLERGSYDVSLRARWVAGATILVVHSEYHAGPFRRTPCITCGVPEPSLSGNSLAAALELSVPFDLGTPGAENSATRALRLRMGEANAGPVIAAVRHDPPVPEPGETATVTARIVDPDGVARATLYWAPNSAAGGFQAVPLADDGLQGDGEAGDGIYGATLPSFASNARVVFYIEAEDERGAVAVSPREAPERTNLVFSGRLNEDGIDTYRYALDAQRTAELQTRELHSNDLLDGTFVFENEEAYHRVGIRYRGSPWGRPTRASHRVRFPDDHVFRDGLRDINISKTGGATTEGAALFLIGRNARVGQPAPSSEYLWVRAELNGADLGRKGSIEPIDGRFLERWFDGADDGPLLKADGRFVFTDSGQLIGQNGWEGASLINRGTNPENYRGYFRHTVRQSADDWEPLIALVHALDPSIVSDADFYDAVTRHVDLDMFFRVLSGRILLGDGDAFGVNNGHNGYLARHSVSGLWTLLAFDAEASLGGQFNLFSSLDPAIQRLLSHPATRRVYMRVLDEYVNGYWSLESARPWLSAVARDVRLSTSSIESQISSGRARVESALAEARAARFRILTNNGESVETEDATIELLAEAPITIESIIISRRGELEPVDALWSSPVRFRTILDLQPGRNDFDLLGFDASGSLVGPIRWTVTRLGDFGERFVRGDANADGTLDISDPIFALAWLFADGASPPCVSSVDANDSGRIDLSDAIYLLDYLFRSGPPIPPPSGACDPDPTPDELTCESYTTCGA